MIGNTVLSITGVIVVLGTIIRFIRHRKALIRQTFNINRIMQTTIYFILFVFGIIAIYDYCRDWF